MDCSKGARPWDGLLSLTFEILGEDGSLKDQGNWSLEFLLKLVGNTTLDRSDSLEGSIVNHDYQSGSLITKGNLLRISDFKKA